MSIAQCLEIFRFRWQIELAFKNLKSVIGLTRMEAKSRDLCLAYISALLILAILVDRMTNEHVPFFPLWVTYPSVRYGGSAATQDTEHVSHSDNKRAY